MEEGQSGEREQNEADAHGPVVGAFGRAVTAQVFRVADHARSPSGQADRCGHGGGAGNAGDAQGADRDDDDGHQEQGEVDRCAAHVAGRDDQQRREDACAALHAGGGAEAEARGAVIDAEFVGQRVDGQRQSADA